jgi:hypothetical protein
LRRFLCSKFVNLNKMKMASKVRVFVVGVGMTKVISRTYIRTEFS